MLVGGRQGVQALAASFLSPTPDWPGCFVDSCNLQTRNPQPARLLKLFSSRHRCQVQPPAATSQTQVTLDKRRHGPGTGANDP